MKILKAKEYIVKCQTCGSKITFNLNDQLPKEPTAFIDQKYITCPHCSARIDTSFKSLGSNEFTLEHNVEVIYEKEEKDV